MSSRKTKPNATTTGPDSQTILSTGGRLRIADMRSCQALVMDFCPSVMDEHGALLRQIAQSSIIQRFESYEKRGCLTERCRKRNTSFIANRPAVINPCRNQASVGLATTVEAPYRCNVTD